MAQARLTAIPSAAIPKRPIWAGPLVAGFCFALAYGVTQRLLGLNVGELIRFGNGFDVQVFPGTSLESLRLRFGEAEAEIRADLELQELQRQQQEQAKRQADEARRLEAEGERREAVLEAVRWHTVGHGRWARVGRALFMADFLEPGRNFLRADRAFLAEHLVHDFDGPIETRRPLTELPFRRIPQRIVPPPRIVPRLGLGVREMQEARPMVEAAVTLVRQVREALDAAVVPGGG